MLLGTLNQEEQGICLVGRNPFNCAGPNPAGDELILMFLFYQGFEETNDGAFLRWLSYQDEGNGAPSPTAGKRPRKNSREMEKHIIAIPSFRVVADYENRQQEVETRRKVGLQKHLIFFVLMMRN